MPRMQILTPAEYAAFEAPPVFTSVDRKRFFSLSQSVLDRLTIFRTPINQIGFVLTLGSERRPNGSLPVSFTLPMPPMWQNSWVFCPACLIWTPTMKPLPDGTAR